METKKFISYQLYTDLKYDNLSKVKNEKIYEYLDSLIGIGDEKYGLYGISVTGEGFLAFNGMIEAFSKKTSKKEYQNLLMGLLVGLKTEIKLLLNDIKNIDLNFAMLSEYIWRE